MSLSPTSEKQRLPKRLFVQECQMCEPRSIRGFTLIELLVVIAIIALLVSILLPSLQKAKDLAKSVVCLSQLKQWSLSLGMYTNDYNNQLFLHDGSNGGVGNPTWEYVLANLEYALNDQNFYRCPAQDKSLMADWTTYVANAYMWGYNYMNSVGFVNGMLGDVKTDPSTSIMMAEYPHLYNDTSSSSMIACGWYHDQCLATIFGAMHNGNINFLFLDGHTEGSEDTGTPSKDYYLFQRYWPVGMAPE